MSNLSELLPTGGGQNAVDFIASGTLGSGVTVALKADGTVEAVAQVVLGQTSGTPALFYNSAACFNPAATFDSNSGKVIVCFQGSGNEGYYAVGTVSGTSITFGSPARVGTDVFTNFNQNCITYDVAAQKVVVIYSDANSSSYIRAIVGSVSGDSISWGTPVVVSSRNTAEFACNYNSTQQKIVVSLLSVIRSYARVGTVSGTSISFGAEITWLFTVSSRHSIVHDPVNNKDVFIFRDRYTYGAAAVATISGTSISVGSSVVFQSSNANYIDATYDSTSGKVVVAYNDGSQYGAAIVGTVSGTSISFGTPVVYKSQVVYWNSIAYDESTNKISIAYSDSSQSGYGKVVPGTVSGTSISFGSETTFESADSDQYSAVYDSTNQKVVIAYSDDGNSGYGTAAVFRNTSTSTNYTDFIGITAGAISDTATGLVNVYGGINEAQTGLTIGADYYVQADGSLSTTASSVKVGKAISATTINMMDLT